VGEDYNFQGWTDFYNILTKQMFAKIVYLYCHFRQKLTANMSFD